jgi:hypothetical protein
MRPTSHPRSWALAGAEPPAFDAARRREPPRHELPEIDVPALDAARAAEAALRAADAVGLDRWIRFLEPLPERLRDGTLRELRTSGRQARAAYGPKDSIRDALPAEVTEPLLVAIDRLLKALARYEAHRD